MKSGKDKWYLTVMYLLALTASEARAIYLSDEDMGTGETYYSDDFWTTPLIFAGIFAGIWIWRWWSRPFSDHPCGDDNNRVPTHFPGESKKPSKSSYDEARRKSDGHKVSEDPKTTFPKAEMQKALANMEIKRIEVHRALRKKGRMF